MDQITICNMSLARIRQDTIESITEANSVGAQYCNLFYDPVRQMALQEHPWQFAKKTKALALTTTDPLGWEYEYQKPSDCLRMLRLAPEGGTDLVRTFVEGEMVYSPSSNGPSKVAFEIEGDVIHANLEEAYGIYIQDVEDVTLFSPAFVKYFYLRLAAEIAMPITGKMALRKAILAEVEEAKMQARALSSLEKHLPNEFHSDLVECRK